VPKRPIVGVAVFVCLVGLGGTAAEGRTARRSATVRKSTASTRSTVQSARRRPAAATPKKKARSASADVDQVAVVMPQQYGPFLPPVIYDYPRPSCDEFDTVVEAHVHESDAETPEPADVADEVPGAEVNAWKTVTRKLGSFLRPKSSESTIRPEDVDLSDLLSAGVQIPVEGVDASSLRDSFLNSRGRHAQHLAIDIGAPKGTPVLAAADGQIMQIRREKRGGNSLYQKDASGKYLLYYCHLSRYVKSVRPGDRVKKGDVIAYVGATGHVIGGSHLHFSITRLPEDDDNFKAGVAINPYLLFLAAVP
jgi:murein DD-endopeptidase MepM/ murein hydrolase activator NlpD